MPVTGVSKADFNAYSIKLFRSQYDIGAATSCGGAIDIDEVASFEIHNLFDKVTESEADLGKTEFRCFYIKNVHPTESIRNPVLVIVQNTASTDDQASIGWGTSPFNGTEQTIATESTYPVNVSFTEAPTRTEGAVLGVNIPPQSHKAVWVRRIVNFNAAEHPQNGFVLRLLTDNVVEEVINEEQIPEPDEDTSFSAVGEFDDNFVMEEIYARLRGRNSNMHICTGNLSAATAMAGSASAIAGNGMAIAKAGSVVAIAGTGIMDRTRLCFGKNDMDTTSKENYWRNRLGIARRYSSYQFQNVHILSMDTASGKANWDDASAQYEFVVDDLTDAAADPATDWIIVLTNRVMYASATDTEPKFVLGELRDLYHPIFEEKGVHIVVQGDFHNYQRSYPLKYNLDTTGSSDVPVLVQSADDPDYVIPAGYDKIEDGGDVGTIFLVDGTGGAAHHNVLGPSFFTVAHNETDHGYIEFYLKNTPEYRRITGAFYRMPLEENPTQVYTDNSYRYRRRPKFKPDVLADKFTITKMLDPNS